MIPKEDVEKVCGALKIGADALRVGLKEGRLPFGTVIGESNYVLYPPKVWEFCGVKVSGYEDFVQK